jgi:hypothetical protein
MSNPKSLAQANLCASAVLPKLVRPNGRQIRRNALKSLVWRNETTLVRPCFVSLGSAFSTQKPRALHTNSRFPRGLTLKSNAQQGISKAPFSERPRRRPCGLRGDLRRRFAAQNEIMETK